MGVFIGSNLTNRSDIIDVMMARIITEVGTPPTGIGATIVRDRSTGVVGSDNVEQWITIPSDRMSSARAMPFGYRPHPSAGNYMESNSSHATYAVASDSDARAFRNFDSQPMNRVDEIGSSTETEAPVGNGYAIATPYLNHWIITNPEFGSLTTHYATGERTYLYMVVEVAANVYRIHGFCDVIQLGTWTTTASGFYQFMTCIQNDGVFGSPGGPGGNIFMGGVMGRKIAPVSAPGGITGAALGDVQPNQMYQSDRDGVNRDWMHQEVFFVSDNLDTLTSNEVRNLGQDHDLNPAAFSGVALRTPMYLYGTRWTVAQVAGSQAFADTDTRWQLLAEIPDAFYCNIRDLDPGTVFDDGIDRFLVLPLYEKGQLGGNNGILLRNAAL